MRYLTNPLAYRKRILSAPLRRTGPEFLRAVEKDSKATPVQQAAAMALLAYGAAPVFIGNILLPFKLIDSGFRGQRRFSHLSYTKTALGYPMPRFNYITPASGAYKTGAKLGGIFGGAAMQTLGHMTPLVGWAPGIERGLVKLKPSPWIKKAGIKTGAKLGGRVGARLIPGIGWAMLAYDVYDISVNRSLWGFDF